MYQLPVINNIPSYIESTDIFGGYNHNSRINENEFYNMKNLSSDYYPVLSQRPRRGIYASPQAPQGMISKDALCCVDGAHFIINGYEVQGLSLSTFESDNPKTLVSMGAYVLIFPDKKYINTKNLSEYGNIEASKTTSGTVTFNLCKADGTGYDNVVAQSAEPSDHSVSWIDTSEATYVLKQWSTSQEAWISVLTTYVKISCTGIGSGFETGDGVNISGITIQSLQNLNASSVITARSDNYIVVTGLLDCVSTTQQEAITIERRMPAFDFIMECENRLWACRYGEANDGSIVNEIYASKLGDFKNWNCFQGISTDSYAVSLGSDGQFTGAAAHKGYPIFFKENCMHKVYGNYPSNYQVQTTVCRGVQKGSDKSLATVNEILFYKSERAVVAYDGSLPTEISYSLGDTVYKNAVAGALGNKYYISMQDQTGTYTLFVYDSSMQIWHKEDNLQADSFCFCRGDLYFIDHKDKKIKTVLGTGSEKEKKIEWFAETGIIGMTMPNKKHLSRIDIRLLAEIGSRIRITVEYDSSGCWEHLATITSKSLNSFVIPVLPNRCDHFRIRIEGSGEIKIFSLCKIYRRRSEF